MSLISSSYPPPNSSALAAYFSSFKKNDYREQAHRLVAKARAFFKDLPPLQPVSCHPKQTDPAPF